VENHEESFAARIMTPNELAICGATPSNVATHLSVKEAIYKCLSPDAQGDIDFQDIELTGCEIVEGNWTEMKGQIQGGLQFDILLHVCDGWILSLARIAFDASP
jgi:phosphopantetheinyl transferase (holo-ACP synthase)